MASESYQAGLKFIYNRQHFGIKLGLHNITRLCEWLGNPQESFGSIHVAGTNGKGSTSSFVARILKESGYKVGILTSPHLADFRERIRVDGKKITEAEITLFVRLYKRLIIKSEATFFEVATALAFWFFHRKKVDFAILETGLGGRLDATNIVTPLVSVITNISLEHTNLLGKTIYKIAGEKGGIIKPSVPLITGIEKNSGPAAQRFSEICQTNRSPITWLDKKKYYHQFANGRDYLNIIGGELAQFRSEIGLAGRHQAENSYVACLTAWELRRQGVKITKKSLARGLASNSWPGRFMTIRKKPRIIIDVAHNREGFATLIETLKNHFPGRKFHFLIGMVEKKKGPQCLKMISSLARSISLVPLKTFRSDDPYYLLSRLDLKKQSTRLYPSASNGLNDLLENCRQSDILVIAGSHFIIGELAPILKRDGF